MSFRELTYSTFSMVSKELEYWLRSKGATHSTRPVMKKIMTKKRKKKDDNPNKVYTVFRCRLMDDEK